MTLQYHNYARNLVLNLAGPVSMTSSSNTKAKQIKPTSTLRYPFGCPKVSRISRYQLRHPLPRQNPHTGVKEPCSLRDTKVNPLTNENYYATNSLARIGTYMDEFQIWVGPGVRSNKYPHLSNATNIQELASEMQTSCENFLRNV